MRVGLPRCGFDLFLRGIGAAVGDVLEDRSTEEDHFLRHDGHAIAQCGERIFARILSVDQHLALIGIVVAQYQ